MLKLFLELIFLVFVYLFANQGVFIITLFLTELNMNDNIIFNFIYIVYLI